MQVLQYIVGSWKETRPNINSMIEWHVEHMDFDFQEKKLLIDLQLGETNWLIILQF